VLSQTLTCVQIFKYLHDLPDTAFACADGRVTGAMNLKSWANAMQADDDDEPILTLPPLPAPVRSEGVMRRWADRQRLKRRAWSQREVLVS